MTYPLYFLPLAYLLGGFTVVGFVRLSEWLGRRDIEANPPDPDSFPSIVIEDGKTLFLYTHSLRQWPGLAVRGVPAGHLRSDERASNVLRASTLEAPDGP